MYSFIFTVNELWLIFGLEFQFGFALNKQKKAFLVLLRKTPDSKYYKLSTTLCVIETLCMHDSHAPGA